MLPQQLGESNFSQPAYFLFSFCYAVARRLNITLDYDERKREEKKRKLHKQANMTFHHVVNSTGVRPRYNLNSVHGRGCTLKPDQCTL
jgi:hypothetical protein